MMIKKMTKHGNSQALVIDRPVLDLLKIDDDTALEIITDGEKLFIAPVRDEGANKKRFEKVLADTSKRRRNALKRMSSD